MGSRRPSLEQAAAAAVRDEELGHEGDETHVCVCCTTSQPASRSASNSRELPGRQPAQRCRRPACCAAAGGNVFVPAERLDPASNPHLSRLCTAVSSIPAPRALASTRADLRQPLGARPATTVALNGALMLIAGRRPCPHASLGPAIGRRHRRCFGCCRRVQPQRAACLEVNGTHKLSCLHGSNSFRCTQASDPWRSGGPLRSG